MLPAPKKCRNSEQYRCKNWALVSLQCVWSQLAGNKNKLNHEVLWDSPQKDWNVAEVLTTWEVKCCDQSCQVRETGSASSALAECCSQHTWPRGCCCDSAEESHHAEGRSKVKQKFLIKNVSWEGVVIASTLENNCVKKSSKPDGNERLLQESPFPTRHHYFCQQLWSKIYPIYKDTFITGYRFQFILRSATHPNTHSGFDTVPALTGLVILSRGVKQTLLFLKCALVAGCEAHKHTLE